MGKEKGSNRRKQGAPRKANEWGQTTINFSGRNQRIVHDGVRMNGLFCTQTAEKEQLKVISDRSLCISCMGDRVPLRRN
jgi:hypothetical protein